MVSIVDRVRFDGQVNYMTVYDFGGREKVLCTCNVMFNQMDVLRITVGAFQAKVEHHDCERV